MYYQRCIWTCTKEEEEAMITKFTLSHTCSSPSLSKVHIVLLFKAFLIIKDCRKCDVVNGFSSSVASWKQKEPII